MISISSNHFSVDDQIRDAVGFLANSDDERDMGAADQFRAAFPEWDKLVWSGSWVDAAASGVDVEYMSSVVDWLESHSRITWEDGEPVVSGMYDHDPIPDDMPEPGDRCKVCGEDLTWVGPSTVYDWMHVGDERNQ